MKTMKIPKGLPKELIPSENQSPIYKELDPSEKAFLDVHNRLRKGHRIEIIGYLLKKPYGFEKLAEKLGVSARVLHSDVKGLEEFGYATHTDGNGYKKIRLTEMGRTVSEIYLNTLKDIDSIIKKGKIPEVITEDPLEHLEDCLGKNEFDSTIFRTFEIAVLNMKIEHGEQIPVRRLTKNFLKRTLASYSEGNEKLNVVKNGIKIPRDSRQTNSIISMLFEIWEKHPYRYIKSNGQLTDKGLKVYELREIEETREEFIKRVSRKKNTLTY